MQNLTMLTGAEINAIAMLAVQRRRRTRQGQEQWEKDPLNVNGTIVVERRGRFTMAVLWLPDEGRHYYGMTKCRLDDQMFSLLGRGMAVYRMFLDFHGIAAHPGQPDFDHTEDLIAEQHFRAIFAQRHAAPAPAPKVEAPVTIPSAN